MATKYYSETLKKGSSGDSVREWQNYLKGQGYAIDVDGQFGSKTEYITKMYQKDNGLSIDGIVGANTWGKAGYSSISTPVSAPTLSKAPTLPTQIDTKFEDTDAGKTALTNKNNAESAVKNYGDFGFSKQNDWNTLYDQYYNRDPFSYDFNADALYQQYKDKYIRQGKLAMADTMGQATAMTGGYGNSYAQSVGQQAYQASLENLNDIVPELYQMAYDRYNQEGQDMLSKLGLLDNERNFEYGQWKDGYDRLVSDRTYANTDYYNQESSHNSNLDRTNTLAHQKYQNEFSAWQEDNDNAQWQATFDEGVRQYLEEMAFKKLQYEDSKKASASTGSSGSSGGSSGSGGSGGSGGSSGGTTSTGSTGSASTSSANKAVVDKAKSYTTKQGQADYLAKQVSNGTITEAEALSILKEHGVVELTERSWELIDDGGVNWLWGVDNNAKVRDEFGNEYTLSELVNELAKTMSKSAAKDYVKKLQKSLGA